MDNNTLILLNNINNKLDSIIQKIDNIENRLNNMEIYNKDLEEKINKFDYHVDFTVQVYNTVKKPMDFFTNTLNKYIGISPIKLPELNYINNNITNNEITE